MAATRPSTVRPEAELLRACARTRLDAGQAARVRALVRPGLDWPLVLTTAQRHGVLPLLGQALRATCPDAVPAPVLADLRRRFLANAQRNLRLTAELIEILGLFAAEGIPAIPYKGPALALAVYGSLALRQFGDLDIVVPPAEVRRARGLLVARGYAPALALTPVQEAAYLRAHADYLLTSGDGRTVVELHWALAAPYFAFPFDLDRLWPRLQPLALGRTTVNHFPPEDLLLLLCVHGSRHLWERLAWLADVAELLRARPELDWARVDAEAAGLGVQRMLRLGLRLARDVLEAALPEPVASRLARDRAVARLAAELDRRLFEAPPGPPGVFENVRYHLRMRERFRDRARYCLLRGLTPTEQDWAGRPPGAPALVHWLRRPARLLRRYGPAAWRPRPGPVRSRIG